MSHGELVEAAGGFKSEPEKLISGGPMMGFAMVALRCTCDKDFFFNSWIYQG
ncbi:MAG: hypothetical protein ACLRUZ_11780 [Faecalimonas sp.]